MSEFERHIFTILLHLPAGKLITYGRLAKSAGYPNHSRQVGKLLSRLPKDSKLPWFRVVNSAGKISLSGDAFIRQKKLLEKEGITVTEQGKIQGFRKYLND
jgi:methylated-DNA-protein-cysteine methyltransferase related protein